MKTQKTPRSYGFHLPSLAALFLVAGFLLTGCSLLNASDGDAAAPDDPVEDPADGMARAECAVDPAAVTFFDALPAETQRQIETARAAAEAFATPEAAAEAGFRPRLGTTPTMGEHWSNPRAGRGGFDPASPNGLMFAPIGGEQQLVGVFYTQRHAEGEPLPEGFHGAYDPWHTHEMQRGPGGQIAMVHLWLVPALEGPFTDHNPYLPYLMAGLPLPPAEQFAEPEQAVRLRKLALALGEAHVPFPNVHLAEERRPALREMLDPHREAIRALVPDLETAMRAEQWSTVNALADRAIAEWEALRVAFTEAVPERMAERYLGASARTMGCVSHHGGGHGSDHNGDHGG